MRAGSFCGTQFTCPPFYHNSERVARAMTVCSRAIFVPSGYRSEAFMDTPIRVEELDFNVSAPHMHATCLEALELAPGHKFLDVGSGCGVLTACGAFLVGKGGVANGIDIRPEAVRHSRECLRVLREQSQEYARLRVVLSGGLLFSCIWTWCRRKDLGLSFRRMIT